MHISCLYLFGCFLWIFYFCIFIDSIYLPFWYEYFYLLIFINSIYLVFWYDYFYLWIFIIFICWLDMNIFIYLLFIFIYLKKQFKYFLYLLFVSIVWFHSRPPLPPAPPQIPEPLPHSGLLFAAFYYYFNISSFLIYLTII